MHTHTHTHTHTRTHTHTGVCPQHDTLYDTLSVSEHLALYARLKGVVPNRIAEAVRVGVCVCVCVMCVCVCVCV